MITRLNNDLDHISRMDTLPNDSAGWTAEQVKAEFDRAANEIKAYLNDVLLPFLEGVNGAGNVGINPIPAVTGALTVQAALEKIELQMAEMTQGAVADGSITAEKLADGSVTSGKLAGGIDSEKIVNGAITVDKLAGGAVTAAKLAALSVLTEKLADLCVTTAKIADKAVTTSQIADAAVGTEQLDSLSVTNAKLANGSVNTNKLYNGAVTSEKLADGAVTAVYSVTLAASDWVQKTNFVELTATVTGLKTTDKIIIDCEMASITSISTLQEITEAYAGFLKAQCNTNGKLYIAAIEKPEVDIPLRILTIRK